MSKECTLKVMEMLEQLDIETEGCEQKDIDLTLRGHVVAQSLRTDIASRDLVHDPMEIVPKGEIERIHGEACQALWLLPPSWSHNSLLPNIPKVK
jgi:hypothetical protein